LRLNAIRSAIKLTPFLPLLLLFAITVFAVRTLLDWLTWWGWSFAFAGIGSVIIGLAGAPLVGGILQLLVLNQGRIPIPPVLASSLAETTSAVARQMLAPVMIEGGILGLIGLGMLILGLFLPRRANGPLMYP
jgi:hypothetical protein